MIAIQYNSGTVHNIPVPLVAGQIHDRLFGVTQSADIRIDTGADISVVPIGFVKNFGLKKANAVDSLSYRVSSTYQVLKDVFELDFILPAPHPKITRVHAIELDMPYALLGVLKAFEAYDLRCDFPPQKISIR